MTDAVKKFIEDHIAFIETKQFDALFDIAYNQLTNVQISQLLNTLNQVGCDIKKSAVEFFQKLVNIAIGVALKGFNPREDPGRFRDTIQMNLYLITVHMDDIGLSDEEKQQIFDRMV